MKEEEEEFRGSESGVKCGRWAIEEKQKETLEEERTGRKEKEEEEEARETGRKCEKRKGKRR